MVAHTQRYPHAKRRVKPLAPGVGGDRRAQRRRTRRIRRRVVGPRACWGREETAAEVGIGGHVGWFSTAIDTLAQGTLVGIDAVVPVTSWLEVRGEAYDGRGAHARLKHAGVETHVEWRPAGPLAFGAEYRRIRTTYFPRAFANDHLNLAFGFEF